MFRNLDVQEENINRTRNAMQVVEEFLSRNKWIAGPTLTIADISYLPIISNAASVSLFEKKFKHVHSGFTSIIGPRTTF